ncbi:MAG TPA: hypothetical protein VKA46_42315 [Gemmataceae bacterium]|nr:hypothetical protein [Gemmataceae bacterium]
MKPMRGTLGALLIATTWAFTCGSPAADTDRKGPAKGEAEVITTRADKNVLAAGIDFATTFGLGFDSLKTLGVRIEQARTAADPVGLAVAATELSVAEQVSGKKTTIKADDLLEEAVQLVKLRKRPEELKAVALIAAQHTDAEALNKQARAAEKEIARRKAGEKTRGVQGTLTVINKTEFNISIYINGLLSGAVAPYDSKEFDVTSPAGNDTVLYARAPGSGAWGPKTVRVDIKNVEWTLNE